MKLTPLDLQQKSFRKVRLGGLDEKEVRQYLDLVASELEEMARKLNRQDEELRRREARINEFKDREQLLQQTLTTAQRLAEEMKAHGRKEADIVLSDAELQAEKIIANAQARRLQLIQEIDELKRARMSFIQQLQGIIEQHRSILEHIKGDQAQQSEPPPPTGDNVSFLAPPVSKKK
ncbi:MAG TPA: DivIVA domain-containing protein [Myxococcales bacterium]|nr:DivIVA domain-containing protein [Myxococcales bacterium]